MFGVQPKRIPRIKLGLFLTSEFCRTIDPVNPRSLRRKAKKKKNRLNKCEDIRNKVVRQFYSFHEQSVQSRTRSKENLRARLEAKNQADR